MAYIYVFDCSQDYTIYENRTNLELLRQEAIKIYNTYYKSTDSNQVKPKQFFIANKFPFYIRPEKEKFNIDHFPKDSYLIKNINTAKRILNENPSAPMIDP